jgi:Fe-S cluster assembly ATP-binding protein
MLSIKNLHASIGGKEILKGINLEVKAGEIHAIMGPNGAGKVRLRQSSQEMKPEVTDGEIILEGEDLRELAPEERAHKGIPFVSVPSRNSWSFSNQFYQISN